MKIDPASQPTSRIYSIMVGAINPRPIAWVSTISPAGKTNLAPFSYFNGVCSKPATLMFSVVNKPDGSPKDTFRNVTSNQEFVVNVVPFRLSQPMAQSAADFEYEVSEFEELGLESVPSNMVTPPGVLTSPIRFECRVSKVVPIGKGPSGVNVVFGEIVLIHVDDEVLNESGEIDAEQLDSIGRLGGKEYSRTTDRFNIT